MARLGTALSLVVLLLCPSLAEAGFAPDPDPIVEAEQLGASGFDTDAQGNSLLAWNQEATLGSGREVKARRLGADGTLGPVFDVAPGDPGFRPAVAMTPSGRAFVAWISRPAFLQPGSVKGRWVEPDGALGPLLTLVEGKAGTMDAVGVQAVVDPAGVVTVTWENEEDFSALALRRVSPDGALSAIALDVSDGAVSEPKIAALPDGSTLVVWRSSGIQANVIAPDLSFDAPEKISEGGSLVAEPGLGIDAAGNAIAAWRESPAMDEYAVRGRRLTPAGPPIGPELTIDAARKGFIRIGVNVAADSSGRFLVDWVRQEDGSNGIAYARTMDAAGAFAGPVQALSTPGLDAGLHKAALLDGGVGTLVWDSDTDGRTVGRTLDPLAQPTSGIEDLFGDSFGPTSTSSAPAAGFAAFLIEYPLSGSAQGTVVQRFLIPPSCTDSSATVVQGSPVSVPISCTGPGLEGTQVVEQPGHGTVAALAGTGGFLYTPRPGYDGPDSFAYAALNDGGSSPPARVNIAVGKDSVKPRIKKLRFIRKGKKFRLVLSEPAKAVIRVKSVTRSGGKRKIKLIGKVTRGKASAKATIKVRGKLARKLLAGGKFRAIAVATDPAKNRSKPKRISFELPG